MSFKTSILNISLPMICLGLFILFAVSLPQTQGQGICDSNGFKDGAESYVTVQRSKRRGAKNKAEILWEPTDMLTDPTQFKVAAAELEIRQDNDESWSIADVDTRNYGKAIKWTVETKPCKTYYFRIRVIGNEISSGKEACLQIPTPLEPLSPDEIRKSGYTPDPPTGFSANVHSGSAELSWAASDCALAYEISYVEAGDDQEKQIRQDQETPTPITVNDLKPCTRYDTFIYAILDDRYSEPAEPTFATQPRTDAATSLDINVSPDLDFATVSWETWKSVSCIDEYKIKACKTGTETCNEEETINRSVGSPLVSHKVEGLEACTDYTLHITPVFEDLNIEVKTVDFRTLSTDASQLNVDRVGSEVRAGGSIFVNWDSVSCAAKYKVYQKEVGQEEWMELATILATEPTETTVNAVTPCTTYQFAISAVLVNADGTESETEKTAGEAQMTSLDHNTPFSAPRFSEIAGDNNLEITWGHADCIDSYIVKWCESLYSDCKTETAVPNDNGDKMITHSIANLTPCTEYDVHIIPVVDGEDENKFQASPNKVSTTNGAPETPNFKVALKDDSSAAMVEWEPVSCASAYKIYYKVESDAEEPEAVATVDRSEAAKIFEENKPCHTYSFSVSTMVNELESERQENSWQNVEIPPKYESLPSLKKIDHNQGNVTLQIDLSDDNKNCGIEEYEVVYSKGSSCCEAKGDCTTETIRIVPEDLIDGKDIVVPVGLGAEENTVFKARVKYTNYNEWSSEVSFGQQSQSLIGGCGESKFPLIPIVVGVAVLALVVIVVTVLLIKRSRNRNFDPEKAENGHTKNVQHENLVNSDEEEREKLNDINA